MNRIICSVIEDSDALQSINADAFGSLYNLGKLLVQVSIYFFLIISNKKKKKNSHVTL